MSENELNNLIASRIKYYMERKGISQVELAEALGVSQQAVSGWCSGNKMPRMDKIDSICKYFGISRNALMNENSYYENDETAEIAQQIFDNKELRLLFSAAKDAAPEDLQLVHNMLLALKRKERGEDE